MANSFTKWAILIGINDYGETKEHPTKRKNTRGEDVSINNLHGCVNDILEVEKYLTESLQVSPRNIKKLVAPIHSHPENENEQPTECPERFNKPTYENIVSTLLDLTISTGKGDIEVPGPRAGDLVYIHYSGHGARVTTVFSKWKREAIGLRQSAAFPGKPDTEDHALVPCDILDGGRFLRDLEVAILLHNMVEKGLRPTIVLDCCHSGGVRRGQNKPKPGSDELVRGIKEVILSTSEDELSDTKDIEQWAKDPYGLYRPKGFVLLAACQELQKAMEFDGRGVFTSSLLEILRSAPLGLSSQALSDSISYTVYEDKIDRENGSKNTRRRKRSQTPLLLGDMDHCFFNETLQARVYGFSVVEKYIETKQIRINGGHIHGVKKNSLYNVLSGGSCLGAEKIDILAQVQVDQVWSGQSLAKLTTPEQPGRWGEVVEGCLAVMHSLPEEEKFTVLFMESPLRERCKRLWQETYGGNAWLTLNDDDAATFEISIDRIGCLAIGGQLDNVTALMGSALPSLPTAGDDDLERSMARVVRILEHLAQYKMFKDLESHKVVSNPSELVCVKVHPPLQAIEIDGSILQPVSKMEPDAQTGLYEAQENHVFQFEVHNQLDRKVHFVIFGCSAEFSIENLYPRDAPYKTLTPKGHSNNMAENPANVTAFIADDLRGATERGWSAVETYKIFASFHANSLVRLNSLTLEALTSVDLGRRQEERALPLAMQSEPQNLREYFDSVGQDPDSDEGRGSRHVAKSIITEPAEWQTKDIRAKVIRVEEQV